jgi:NAD(P)-dependent dehydrogenase (short-subunit alcohol dehydrogenase family)
VLVDNNQERLDEVTEAVAAAGGKAEGSVVDLLDETATRRWVRDVEDRHGRVDGLVHLVGGWRGGVHLAEADLADWDLLHDLLIRTVQHTSRAAYEPLRRSPGGRYVLISSIQATRPTADNSCYAAAKAAAEAWTLSLADAFKGSPAAATIVVLKALLTPTMRQAKPDAKFTGYTGVDELADVVGGLWERSTDEVNGERVWLAQ